MSEVVNEDMTAHQSDTEGWEQLGLDGRSYHATAFVSDTDQLTEPENPTIVALGGVVFST